MRIAVDLDDVVLDFCGGLCAALRKEYNVALTPEDIQAWDLHKVLDPIIGYSWWTWLRKRDWLWPNFDAVDGAIGALDTLRNQGHYLECVTSKPEWAEASVWKWLGKWRPPFNAVTIVGPEDRKSDFSDALLLIDDKPANCEGWVRGSMTRKAILFERPHNTGSRNVYPGMVLRAQSWESVLGWVEKLEEVHV